MTVCGWEPDYAECTATGALEGLSDALRAKVEMMAAEFLWNWTGRVYGPCEVTVRPARQGCFGGPGSAYSGARLPWAPALVGGRWINVACGRCGTSCGCESTKVLNLGWPVSEVTGVMVDGEGVTAYRLDNHALLVRTDGGSWPTCQDLDAAPTEPGTFLVSFTRGLPVPVGGLIAQGLLAEEMAKALCNDNTCQLPQRIQSITRQGVTVAIVDDFKGLSENGRTGIWLVDSWVASVTKPKQGGTVMSPDVPRRRHPGAVLP